MIEAIALPVVSLGAFAALVTFAILALNSVRKDDRSLIQSHIESNERLIEKLLIVRIPDLELARLHAERDAAIAANEAMKPEPKDPPRRRPVESMDDVLSEEEMAVGFAGNGSGLD